MTKESQKKRAGRMIAALAVLIAATLILYANGYRIDGFSLVKTGLLRVHAPLDETLVFIDEKKRETPLEKNALAEESLAPGEHSILAVKDGYWPWSKKVIVEAGTATDIRPFLLPIHPRGQEIGIHDSRYDSAVSLFEQKGGEVEKTESDLLSPNGLIAIKREGGAIAAVWRGEESERPKYLCEGEVCENELVIFDGDESLLKDILFFPGREDVIMFSFDDAVYVLEIDKTDIQNFQPLYRGEDPRVALDSDGSLYVFDNGSYIRLEI
ncbi:hypothetical protein L0Y41_03820 [bacterium]|nr:hypothetical protein [bacterium]